MKEVLDYFKSVVISDEQSVGNINTSLIRYGIVLDFVPDENQTKILQSCINSNDFRTLFSVKEANNLSIDEFFIKQIMHYYAQFVLGNGQMVMNYEYNDEPITVNFIRGITVKQLADKVNEILLANKPVKNVDVLARIIKYYKIDFDINDIENNELRIALFDETNNTFTDGDDAVRYIVYKCTNDTLLIKSKKVLEEVRLNSKKISSNFLNKHVLSLAKCFNRHKAILMSVKIGATKSLLRTTINRIARLSKEHHTPVYTAKSKTFIADSIKDKKVNHKVLASMPMRDKFKILNLLRFKMNGLDSDIFVIRNGKVWEERSNRTVYKIHDLVDLEREVVNSIVNDLSYLKGKKILIQNEVDYGLPVSRKQTVGHLPFGTSIAVNGNISAGIYWKGEWGAHDLDLSAIDMNGDRVGWGFGGYNRSDIVFSGDMVNPTPDAMEFMTSSKSKYMLCVNIFSGNEGSKAQVIVGKSKNKWIDKGIVREDIELKSRGNIIGLVENNKYIAYQGRLNERRANFNASNTQLQKALTFHWTTKKIFDILGVEYGSSVENPDYDLTLEGFTIDKLEKVFSI